MSEGACTCGNQHNPTVIDGWYPACAPYCATRTPSRPAREIKELPHTEEDLLKVAHLLIGYWTDESPDEINDEGYCRHGYGDPDPDSSAHPHKCPHMRATEWMRAYARRGRG